MQKYHDEPKQYKGYLKSALEGGASYRAIARRLGRAPSTIAREVNGHSGRRRYRACRADEAAYKRARRPKATKFRQCPRLRAQVESMLNAQWSPQQISARLTIDYPDDPEMRVSHETIYRSLRPVQGGVAQRAHRVSAFGAFGAYPSSPAWAQRSRRLYQRYGPHRGSTG